MNTKNLIIYKFDILYQILSELDKFIDFNLIDVQDEKTLNYKIVELKNFIILTKKKVPKVEFQLIFDFPTLNISKLIEVFNVEFIKKNFNKKSKFQIKNYIINFNSREMLHKNIKLKLTEKEIHILYYLSKKNFAKVNELEKYVWLYQDDIETHTVETHIYRLRKKILEKFNDKNFLITSDNGYCINK